MKYILKHFLVTFFVIFTTNLFAQDNIAILDLKYVLNESKAGKEAQYFLKNKLDKGIKKLQEVEKSIQAEEKEIIKQKKIISAEEYKKKVNNLRGKVSKLQNDRKKLFGDVAKQRKKAKTELLNNLNPIIQDYMKEKNMHTLHQ